MSVDLVLAGFIYLVAELPPSPSDIALNDDEETLLLIHKIKYRALSLFLRWIRLGEPQSEVLLLPEVQGYEPLARFWDSFLTLVIELHPRTDDGLIRAFRSPAELWYACIALISRDAFYQALTGYPPFRLKKESIKNMRDSFKLLNQLDKISQLKLSSGLAEDATYIDTTKHPGGSLMVRIFLQAGQIAATETKFDKRYYQPCLRACRRVFGSANEDENARMPHIDSKRQLFMTQQSKKRPPSTKE